MHSRYCQHGFLSLIVLALIGAAASAAKPVDAPRPNADFRETRQVIVELSRTAKTLIRGKRAGMLPDVDIGPRISNLLKKLEKNKAFQRFARDESVTEMERAERICLWIMNRSLKKKERNSIVKYFAGKKERSGLFPELVWAFLNTREFVTGK